MRVRRVARGVTGSLLIFLACRCFPGIIPLFVLTGLALPAPGVDRAAMTAAATTEMTIALNGAWRFALDREARGIEEGWWRRRLAGTAALPGTLTGQGVGDPITLETPWIGQIVDKSFFTAPEYAPYRRPGQHQGAVLAPARPLLRGRGLVSDGRRRAGGVEGPPPGPAPRAPALADAWWRSTRAVDRLERQPVDRRTNTTWARASHPARTC